MNTTREQVNHTKFGAGTIIAQDTTTVTVKFSKEYGSKKFLYPSAFKAFLELLNPSAKKQMDNELQSIQDLAERVQNTRIIGREEMEAILEAKNALKKKAPVKKRIPRKSTNVIGEVSQE